MAIEYSIDFLMVIKLILAVLMGGVIGLTRRNKPAGTRTFALICFGSTIFTTISIFPYFNSDPMRVIAQIVSGIGFLGLGVIWRHGAGKPAGLTTAAGIWVTAAIGVLIGLGFWFEAVVSMSLAVLILYSKQPIEKTEKNFEKLVHLPLNGNSYNKKKNGN